MKKLEQAAREVIRQHSMECLSDKTIAALREALAEQAEQEPVGYFAYDAEQQCWDHVIGKESEGAVAFYTASVRTKDLTDDEILKIAVDTVPLTTHFARAVIAADRKKNK